MARDSKSTIPGDSKPDKEAARPKIILIQSRRPALLSLPDQQIEAQQTMANLKVGLDLLSREFEHIRERLSR